MAMSRKRRIMLGIAAPPALLWCYVASYITSGCVLGAGILDVTAIDAMDQTVFAPIAWCIDSRQPGGYTIEKFTSWCENRAAGNDISWEDGHPR